MTGVFSGGGGGGETVRTLSKDGCSVINSKMDSFDRKRGIGPAFFKKLLGKGLAARTLSL